MRPFWISSPQSFFVRACDRGWRIPIMVCSTEAIAEGEAKRQGVIGKRSYSLLLSLGLVYLVD